MYVLRALDGDYAGEDAGCIVVLIEWSSNAAFFNLVFKFTVRLNVSSLSAFLSGLVALIGGFFGETISIFDFYLISGV